MTEMPFIPSAPNICPADIHVELIAVIVAVGNSTPLVMTRGGADRLPSGPFALQDRSLQTGLRRWVEALTGHPLGYVEQLYTFADSDRVATSGRGRAISISYLGLTPPDPVPEARAAQAAWRGWYGYFPWEDHRVGPPSALAALKPRLRDWARTLGEGPGAEAWGRAAGLFGWNGELWNDELVLQRYEMLYGAGLVAEAGGADPVPGLPMSGDHRRILATAMARLRSKIKYRPVVFELMPPEFTLLKLQRTVEALSGRLLHKQNFRRLVEQQELVEETGGIEADTGGRPAKLFRFRSAVHRERTFYGTRPPLSRP